MLTVTIDTNAKDCAERWRKLHRYMPTVILRGAQAAALLGARRTINRKLTKANPPYLNRKTGALVRSVKYSLREERAVIDGNVARAGYGTDKDYGKKHEIGGTYTEAVKAHTRRIASRNLRVGRAKIASGVAFVRAHSRVRTYRARHMFAHGLRESEDQSLLPTRHMIDGLFRSGTIPSWREVVDSLEPEPTWTNK